jgi:hypothetical protein
VNDGEQTLGMIDIPLGYKGTVPSVLFYLLRPFAECAWGRRGEGNFYLVLPGGVMK